MSIRYDRSAQIDLDEIEYNLAIHQGLRAVAQFQSRLEKTLARLERFPFSAAIYDPPDPRYPGMRVSPVQRSKWFAVFYLPLPDGIRVVRVLHTSRDIAAIFTPPESR